MASFMLVVALQVTVLLLFLVTVTSSANPVYTSPAKCGQGFAFNAPRMRTTVKSSKECEALCTKMENCKSYQVSSGMKRCQLLKRTAGKWALRMSPRKGWAYRERFTDGSSISCQKFPYATCSPVIESFSNVISVTRGNVWGGFTRDSVIPNGKYYWLPYHGNEVLIYRYADDAALWADRKEELYMNWGCHGAQFAVRDSKIWCKEYNNRNIVVYDFDRRMVVARINFDSVIDDQGSNYYAGYSDHCHYDWGGQSDMDVMTDYGGMMYILWGRHNSWGTNCLMAVTQIDPDTYEKKETYYLDTDKRQYGNCFIVCGRVYCTDTVHGHPSTYFQLIWDLRTGNFTYFYWNEQNYYGYLKMPNRENYNSMLDFNPLEGKLYKWNNNRFGRMKVNFAPRPDDLFLPVP